MKGRLENMEMEPAISLLKLISSQLQGTAENMAAYFKPIDQSNHELAILRHGKIYPSNSSNKKLNLDYITFDVEVSAYSKLPDVIKTQLKQQTLLYESDDKDGNHIVSLRFKAISGITTDFYVILITKTLKEFIKKALKSSGLFKEKEFTLTHIKAYFFNFYQLYVECIKSETTKYGYTKELIDALQKAYSQNQRLNNKLSEIDELKKAQILEQANVIVKQEAEKYGMDFSFSGDALNLIGDYKGETQILRKALMDAVKLSYNISYFNKDKPCVIQREMIHFDKEKEVGVDSQLKKGRIDKAKLYLNKYEDSANRVMDKRIKLTIKTLAFYVRPEKVSASAISLCVKKYRDEMKLLLGTQKTSWPIIRTYFGPVAKLSE